jgi:hypothetical protein
MSGSAPGVTGPGRRTGPPVPSAAPRSSTKPCHWSGGAARPRAEDVRQAPSEGPSAMSLERWRRRAGSPLEQAHLLLVVVGAGGWGQVVEPVTSSRDLEA